VAAAFTVTLDPEALKDKVTLDPAKEAAVVTGSSPDIELTAYAKRIVKRPGILRVELYFENKSDTALRDVIVTAKDAGASTPFYDFTNDVFAEASPPALSTSGASRRGASGGSSWASRIRGSRRSPSNSRASGRSVDRRPRPPSS
jgi:hypothetical protein